MNYRAEVDGLRAIAVFSVIIYHSKINVLGKPLFEGGFIGVDIFFVISGYLITRIILSELAKNGSFDFSNFYIKRIRRILPVLFIVMLVSFPFAWTSLLPNDFIEYSKSIISAVFFGSNFFFYFATTDYGADSSLLKPFLHTWSLSIEEQFYIVFPVFLVSLYYFCNRYILIIFIALLLLSLQVAQVMDSLNSGLNFFFPISRFWELFAGSIIAYVELKHGKVKNTLASNILPIFGLCLIFYSIFFFDSKTPHPGYITIIPVIGVALILVFSSSKDLVGKLLSTSPFVGLGIISYSAYLWHFPIFAFFRLGEVDDIDIYVKISLIVITIILSILSYFCIEKTFRKVFSKRLSLLLIALLGILIVISNLSVINYGGFAFESRFGFNPSFLTADKRNEALESECFLDPLKLEKTEWCVIGNNASTTYDYIIIGDSHALSSLKLLDELGVEFGKKGLYARRDGCVALLGVYPIRGNPHPNKQSKECFNTIQDARIIAEKYHVKNVFLISRWDYYVDGNNTGDFNNITDLSLKKGSIENARKVYKDAVFDTIESFSKIDTNLVVMLQAPHQNVNITRILEGMLKRGGLDSVANYLEDISSQYVTKKQHLIKQEIANEPWYRSAAQGDSIEIIDPASVLCLEGGRCMVFDEFSAIYYDDDHLSAYGFDKLKKLFAQYF